jgi:hypothetical protein
MMPSQMFGPAKNEAVKEAQAVAQVIDGWHHPQMGEALDAPAGVRRWIAGPYVVHYTIDGQVLIVLRIWAWARAAHRNLAVRRPALKSQFATSKTKLSGRGGRAYQS